MIQTEHSKTVTRTSLLGEQASPAGRGTSNPVSLVGERASTCMLRAWTPEGLSS